MTDILADFNQYHVGYVLNHFGMVADNSVESQTVQLLYKVNGNYCAVDSPHLKKIALAKEVVETTIDKIGIGYNLYRKYGDDSFRGLEDIKYNALKIAILCGSSILDIQIDTKPAPEISPLPVKEKIVIIPDTLDDVSLIMAKEFWEDAEDLKDYGYYDTSIEISPEPLFIAQIMSLKHILDLQDELADSDTDKNVINEFKLFLNRNMADMRTLVNHTEIGRELASRLDIIETLLQQAIQDFSASPLMITNQSKPLNPPFKLTLVPSPE